MRQSALPIGPACKGCGEPFPSLSAGKCERCTALERKRPGLAKAKPRAKAVDASKRCLNCNEVGHRYDECTRMRRRPPLPKVQCVACADVGDDAVAILRKHGFDKRAALAEVAEITDETGTYYSGSYWEMTRRTLAFSDWPRDATWYHDRFDPLDEEARRRAWGLP